MFKTYEPSDIYLAAFLITQGGIWSRTVGDPKKRFQIQMSDENYERACTEYRSNITTRNVNVFQYVSAVNMLKKELRNHL